MRPWTIRRSLHTAGLVGVALASMISESTATAPCFRPDKKTCKIPEDCMVKRQIAMKRAFRDAFASAAMRCKALKAARKKLGPAATPEQVSAQAADLLYADIAGHPERVAKNLPACKSSPLKDPPGFSTGDDCVFQADVNDPDGVNTCSEFLDAARNHERNHVKNCKAARDKQETDLGDKSSSVPHGRSCEGASFNAGQPKVPNRQNLNDYADEEADSYSIEVEELENGRKAAIHACTTARAAEAAAANASKNARALKAMGGGR